MLPTRILLVVVAVAILVFAIWVIITKGAVICRTVIGWFSPTNGTKRLHAIPKIIRKMHERLTSLVADMPLLTKTEVASLSDDYLELWGLVESTYPALKQITPMSDVKADREVLRAVLENLLQKFTEVDDIKSLLIRTGGLMNTRGTGISQMRDKDRQYAQLEKRLAKVRPEIPTELNTSIDNYLQFSFGVISLNRLILSIPYNEIANALPSMWVGEIGIWKERIDIVMNELLAEVKDVINKLTQTANEIAN